MHTGQFAPPMLNFIPFPPQDRRLYIGCVLDGSTAPLLSTAKHFPRRLSPFFYAPLRAIIASWSSLSGEARTASRISRLDYRQVTHDKVSFPVPTDRSYRYYTASGLRSSPPCLRLWQTLFSFSFVVGFLQTLCPVLLSDSNTLYPGCWSFLRPDTGFTAFSPFPPLARPDDARLHCCPGSARKPTLDRRTRIPPHTPPTKHPRTPSTLKT